MKFIASPQNDTVKTLARLVDKPAERRRAGVVVLEGLHLLDACLDRHDDVRQVLVRDDALDHPEVAALLRRLPASCERLALAPAALKKLSSLASPPEIIAVAGLPPSRRPADPSCLLLEDVQDPGNLGTILRTAAAAGVFTVYLSAGCADVWSAKVLRAGMGAHFVLDIVENADLADVLGRFAGKRLVTHLAATQSLYQLELSGPCAFVFGNEGAGVSETLAALAQDKVLIPMPGEAESLNVAVAAAVCLFERVRQRAGGRP